jgi:hypothetical protein
MGVSQGISLPYSRPIGLSLLAINFLLTLVVTRCVQYVQQHYPGSRISRGAAWVRSWFRHQINFWFLPEDVLEFYLQTSDGSHSFFIEGDFTPSVSPNADKSRINELNQRPQPHGPTRSRQTSDCSGSGLTVERPNFELERFMEDLI